VRARALPLLQLVAIAAIAAVALPGSATAAAPPAPPDPTCSPGPSSCFAWHTTDVDVSWAGPPSGVTASGCNGTKISDDTGGASVSCTWSNGEGSRTTTAKVRRDASPPSVSASPDRGPDVNGWYNHEVSIGFSGTDPTSGIASCSSGGYGGPDTAGAAVVGRCSNGAGLTGEASVEIKYDATPPTVTVKPERPPDANGWYNHPVTVSFEGADALSGLEVCTPPVLYKGPGIAKGSLKGECKDKAANTSAPAVFEFSYDARPPKLTRVKAQIRKDRVIVRWTASKDARSFSVLRRPGLKGAKPSKVYTGPKRAFADRRVKKGVKYRYVVTAYDQAANTAVKGLGAKVGISTAKTRAPKPVPKSKQRVLRGLTQPAKNARVKAPLLLRWRAVSKASYYNVQLHRDGKKIRTAWTTGTKLRLGRFWSFEGKNYILSKGRYRWYVWPGFGRPADARFGKLIGSRSFVVTS
jgi:hypothetical protein